MYMYVCIYIYIYIYIHIYIYIIGGGRMRHNKKMFVHQRPSRHAPGLHNKIPA